MSSIGDKIRQLRKQRRMPLREVAQALEIDQAILSKMERGQRRISREQVVQLARFFEIELEELLVVWLSDKILYTVGEEDSALKALHMAEEKITYKAIRKTAQGHLLHQIKVILSRFPSISKTWLYGSFSRGEERPDSDIDLAVLADDTLSYFDLAEIQHLLEKEIHRKVDIGFVDAFKPHIRKQVEPDLRLIYERPTG